MGQNTVERKAIVKKKLLRCCGNKRGVFKESSPQNCRNSKSIVCTPGETFLEKYLCYMCDMLKSLNHVPYIACLICDSLKTNWIHADIRAVARAEWQHADSHIQHCILESAFAGLVEIVSCQCFKCLALAAYYLSGRT